jgi:hypothetical protein
MLPRIARFLETLHQTDFYKSFSEDSMARQEVREGERAWCQIKCWGCAGIAAYTFSTTAAVQRIEIESPLWCGPCFNSAVEKEARAASRRRPRAKEKPHG